MKSWKTTLLGWGLGASYTALTIASTGLKPKDALLAIGIGLLGTFAKDYDKTNAPHPADTRNSDGTKS